MPAAKNPIIRRIRKNLKAFSGTAPRGGLGRGFRELSAADKVRLAQRLQVAWGEKGRASHPKALGRAERIIAGKRIGGLDKFLESEEALEMRYKMEELWDSAGKETNYAFDSKDKAVLEGIRQKMISGSCNEKDYANLARLHQKYSFQIEKFDRQGKRQK